MEQERLQMAMIDWHDFVAVDTIDFADDEDEDLPPPMTLEMVIRRSKMSAVEEEEIAEPGKEVQMEMDEEELQLDEEGMKAARLQENGEDRKNDEQPKKVIWDGHTGSIGRTATQAMSQNANGEDQIDGVNSGSLTGPVAPPRPGGR